MLDKGPMLLAGSDPYSFRKSSNLLHDQEGGTSSETDAPGTGDDTYSDGTGIIGDDAKRGFWQDYEDF